MKKFSYGYMQGHELNVVTRDSGWLCIHGDVASVDVYMVQRGSVTFRKAMI